MTGNAQAVDFIPSLQLPKGPGLMEIEWSKAIQDPALSGRAYDTLQDWADTQVQAQDYLLFRRNVSDSKKLREAMSLCPTSPEELSKKPFCVLQELYLKSRREQVRKEKRASVSEAQRVIRGWIQGLTQRKWSQLTELDDALLPLAIKSLNRLRDSENQVRQMLAYQSCPPVSLLVALGFSAETRFPQESARAQAELLYERAMLCGKGFLSQMAGFRAGLIQIWREDRKKADALLEKVLDFSPSAPEFRMRALYWRYYLATQDKDIKLAERMFTELIRDYPLSLYALLVKPGSQPGVSSGPLKIRLRSLQSLELNRITRAVEVLLALGERFSAVQLLRFYSEQALKKNELPFLLYWLWLFQRAGDRPGTFQFLAGLIRNDPSMMTRQLLELMYPLVNFERVRQASTPHLDPFLILSVIRQESAFNEEVVSSAGAIGLMQLQWGTAKRFERVARHNLREPVTNLRIGVKYLNNLRDYFHGDLQLALVGYNAGPGRLREWLPRYPQTPMLLFLDMLPLRETRDYVTSIARNYGWYQRLYGMAGSAASSVPFSILDPPKGMGQSPRSLGN